MFRHILTVSSGTFVSRLLGFARDALAAALLGAGPAADAFLMAFQLVHVVRRLLSEGALNAALVPAWTRVRDSAGPAAAAAFAGRVLGTVSTILVAAVVVVGFVMPWIVTVLAPGFAGRETLWFAVTDARLMLPYLAFSGPVTVMMGLLNAQHRFALTSFAPLLFNVALIGAMTALLAQGQGAQTAALVMAATVGIAGLVQLLALAIPGRRAAPATPLRIAFDREMRGFLGTAGPGMIASAAPQLLIVGGTIIASLSPSAVSWLYFANRLIELPLGIVGVAMGTVLVPELTRAVSAGDRSVTAHAESRALELAIGLALPATLGLIVLAGPIVRLLFEHGAFTPADGSATATTLCWLAAGLPAHVLVKALAPAFFARGDTLTPLHATLKGLAVAMAFALVLGHFGGAAGIAAALAAGAWSNATSLLRHGRASFGFSLDDTARRRLPRIATAAVAMGILLWLAAHTALPWVTDAHRLALAALVGVLITAGMAVYGLLLTLSGAIDPA
ncbi:MAG TPA: murein biosynthesis integral membrane protein MurJ [Nitrobacter sp.]|nr:murein biosynthesis integral membrane protein MurJ [Nitrobacter sp.]